MGAVSVGGETSVFGADDVSNCRSIVPTTIPGWLSQCQMVLPWVSVAGNRQPPQLSDTLMESDIVPIPLSGIGPCSSLLIITVRIKQMNPHVFYPSHGAAILFCPVFCRRLRLTSTCPRVRIANVAACLFSGFGHMTFAIRARVHFVVGFQSMGSQHWGEAVSKMEEWNDKLCYLKFFFKKAWIIILL